MPKNEVDRLEYLDKRKRLSPTEKEFMELMWAKESEATPEDFFRSFPMARSTVSVVLLHLCEKRYATFRKEGRNTFYSPSVSKLQYERAAMQQKMKRAIGTGEFSKMAAMYCGLSDLTDEEKEEADRFLKKLEKRFDKENNK